MKRSQTYMLAGALLLSGLFIWPMWNITLEAPQYPDPIGFDIHIDKFEDAKPNDIKNINIMNHYVGMKDIPESIPEFDIFPKVAWGMIGLGIVIAFIGKRQLYISWFALMLVFGIIAMYDFYLWEYDYGHDLKENAAIKFTDEDGKPMAYQPPLIGAKMILNFKAISMPRLGAYSMFLGMALSVLAFVKAKKEKTSIQVMAAFLIVGLISGCSSGPQPIEYGHDACVFCKMTIVDKQHAAQVVTRTGKNFKYDAIECMMNDLKDWGHPEVEIILVADYANPGKLSDATDAFFLISQDIPSPMGEFLTAFENENDRMETMKDVSGETYNWASLKSEFEVQ